MLYKVPPNKQKILDLVLQRKANTSTCKNLLLQCLTHIFLGVAALHAIPRIGIMLYSVFPCGLVLYLANILGYLCGSSFFLSALFGAFKFTVPRLLPAVRLETTQMKLFGIHKSDPGFQEISPEKEKPKEKTSTPLSYRKVVDLPLTPVESVNVSWAELPGNTSYLTSTDSLSPVSSQSLSLDSTTSSWTYRRTSKASSPIDERQNISGREGESKIVDESFRRKIFHSKSLLSVTQTDEGIDYDSLERTSKLMNELERGLTSPEQTKLYSTRSTFGDFSPVIRGHYQLATSSPADKGLENESSKVAASHRGEQIWQTLKVDDSSLLQWRQNFRCWLSDSVLRPLVAEIDKVNSTLSTHGMSEGHIGHDSLDKLRKTLQIPAIHYLLPSFENLLPYLEVTTNQEYLIKRTKELAGGGCIGAYRWNSGGSFKGKDWDENLPTDTQILMHFLSVYLNSCLPVYGDRPDKKPFSSRHYFTRQDKLEPLDTVAIIEEKIHPPLFSVSDGDISWEVAKGRNNFIDSVLLFFYLIKQKSEGVIGRMLLDTAGLNIAWIFNSKMG
ncbi:transmembrane protein 209-like isoform X2 [Artemia franciscana]|uniref:transmembrane protein 209-like isoform X2 n=1 Tax=Artemia franciscana TaxID=6661 RepID=UPI0032DAF539